MKPSTSTSKGALAFGAAVDVVTLAAGEDGEPLDWVRLLPMGTFAGRDGRGPYRIDDLAHAEAIVAASAERLSGLDAVVDYDHQTDLAAIAGVGGKAPASGWIKEMQARVDGIFGRIEWTPEAQADLKAKRYRYLSPVFPHEKSTGRVRAILRAGLTNKPNLDLGALASMADNPGDDDLDKTKLATAPLITILGLGEDATEDQIHAAITGLKAKGDGVSTIALAAGLTADAAATDIVTAIAAAGAGGGTPDPAKFVPIETVLALQSQIVSGKVENAKEKAEADVDAGIAAGKIVPSLRDTMVALASSDRPKFDEIVSKAPVIIAPGAVTTTGKVDADATVLTAEDKAICASMGLDEADFLATKKDGI